MNKTEKRQIELVQDIKSHMDNTNNLSILAYDVEGRIEEEMDNGLSFNAAINVAVQELQESYKRVLAEMFQMGEKLENINQ